MLMYRWIFNWPLNRVCNYSVVDGPIAVVKEATYKDSVTCLTGDYFLIDPSSVYKMVAQNK